jgi:UDPglucose 6-dehydrogenase
MTSRICVYGLWHLGSVTAACLAEQGFEVIGLDPDQPRVAALGAGHAPIAEPGLDELIQEGLKRSTLRFTNDSAEALAKADVLWTTFDTPVDEDDRADPDWVRAQLDEVRQHVRAGTLIVISSQVPVGFCASLERDWKAREPSLQVACVPENLRLGQALAAFRSAERFVVGLSSATDRQPIEQLLQPFTQHIEWMSLESAEMTKHALNAFLALSIAYTNELARLCERVGADAREVERGLRSDPRIGPRAYVTPGAPFAGGTLARDVTVLGQLARAHDMQSPVFDAVLVSNRLHADWARERVTALLANVAKPRVALLGLTYKPGTDTLRRSSSVELGRWLAARHVDVSAYDPAVRQASPELGAIKLRDELIGALSGADVAVLGTAWPEFRSIRAEDLLATMRHPVVVDAAGFLAHLADDPRLTYARVGKPALAENGAS